MGSAARYGKRTTEEIRTFLGVFVVSDDYIFLTFGFLHAAHSDVVISIGRIFRKQHLLCDPELAIQYCKELLEAKEMNSDVWIQHYVRLTILSRKANDTFSYHNPKNGKILGEASI